MYELLQISLDADSPDSKDVKTRILDDLKVCLGMNDQPHSTPSGQATTSKYATELLQARKEVNERLAKQRSERKVKDAAVKVSQKAGQLGTIMNAYYGHDQDTSKGEGSTNSSAKKTAAHKRKFEEDFDKDFEELDRKSVV